MPETRHDQISFNTVRLILGISALAIGVLVYLLDRPAGQTYFIPDTINISGSLPSVFGTLGNQLPTFLHTLSFCLITAALFRVRLRGALVISTSWLLIDAAFEIGQHAEIAPVLARGIPDWFEHIPVLDNTANYFLNGRFDPLDLVSIVSGALLAVPLILATRRFDPVGDGKTNGV